MIQPRERQAIRVAFVLRRATERIRVARRRLTASNEHLRAARNPVPDVPRESRVLAEERPSFADDEYRLAFLAKAPDNVVDKIRGRLAKADEDIARIKAQLDGLPQQ